MGYLKCPGQVVNSAPCLQNIAKLLLLPGNVWGTEGRGNTQTQRSSAERRGQQTHGHQEKTFRVRWTCIALRQTLLVPLGDAAVPDSYGGLEAEDNYCRWHGESEPRAGLLPALRSVREHESQKWASHHLGHQNLPWLSLWPCVSKNRRQAP